MTSTFIRPLGVDNLERILHHEMQLLELRVLTNGPVVHLSAEMYCLRQRLLKNIISVDFDEEGELAGTTDRCNVKLWSEEFLLTAYSDQELPDFIEDDVPVRFIIGRAICWGRADEGILVRLGNEHGSRRVPIKLIVQVLFNLVKVEVQESEELARQEPLRLYALGRHPVRNTGLIGSSTASRTSSVGRRDHRVVLCAEFNLVWVGDITD